MAFNDIEDGVRVGVGPRRVETPAAVLESALDGEGPLEVDVASALAVVGGDVGAGIQCDAAHDAVVVGALEDGGGHGRLHVLRDIPGVAQPSATPLAGTPLAPSDELLVEEGRDRRDGDAAGVAAAADGDALAGGLGRCRRSHDEGQRHIVHDLLVEARTLDVVLVLTDCEGAGVAGVDGDVEGAVGHVVLSGCD